MTLYEEELSVIEDVEEAASDSPTLPFWPMPHDAPCLKCPMMPHALKSLKMPPLLSLRGKVFNHIILNIRMKRHPFNVLDSLLQGESDCYKIQWNLFIAF